MQHIFDVDVATKYGLTEAILLSNLYYWIEHNRANERNYYNGTYWTYNSVKAFKTLFPYLSERKIHNALKRLQEQGIIETGNFNENTYDRTLWYSLTKVGHCIMQKCKMDNAILSNGNVENVKSTYTDINTDINADSNITARARKENSEKAVNKIAYADDVLLTETEYSALIAKLGSKQAADECIEILSNYKGATDKKYKSDYKAILNWVIDKWRERHRAEQRGQPQLKNDPVRAAAMVKAMLAEQERRRQNADGYCN